MARIRIVFSEVRDANERLKAVLRRAGRLERRLELLRSQMDVDVQARYQIGERLRMCQEQISALTLSAKRIYDVVEDGWSRYEQLEAGLLSRQLLVSQTAAERQGQEQ